MPGRPARVIEKTDLILFAIDGQKYAAFILPGPARPALIGVSSIALTREARIESSCASWIGSSSDADACINCVNHARLTSIPASTNRWCWRYSGRWKANLSMALALGYPVGQPLTGRTYLRIT